MIYLLGNGNFKLREEKEEGKFDQKQSADHVAMLCGGTGLAPMLQVIRAIIQNKNDKTKVTLIFANKTEADILRKEELDQMAKVRFHLGHRQQLLPDNCPSKRRTGEFKIFQN